MYFDLTTRDAHHHLPYVYSNATGAHHDHSSYVYYEIEDLSLAEETSRVLNRRPGDQWFALVFVCVLEDLLKVGTPCHQTAASSSRFESIA